MVKLACWNLFSLSQRVDFFFFKGGEKLSNLNLLSVQAAPLGTAPSSRWVPLPARLGLTATVQTQKGSQHAGTILSAVWVSLVLKRASPPGRCSAATFRALPCHSLPWELITRSWGFAYSLLCFITPPL